MKNALLIWHDARFCILFLNNIAYQALIHTQEKGALYPPFAQKMKNHREETKALLEEYSKGRKNRKDTALPDYSPKLQFKAVDRKQASIKGLIYLFATDPNHPMIRTKPDGVKNIGIRIAIVDDAEVPADMCYKTLPPFPYTYVRLFFEEKDLNKRVFIKAFYIGKNDEEGPDSEAISTIIR